MKRTEILEIVNSLKPGETAEIPNYGLMQAMYHDDPAAVDWTMQYSYDYVNKIAEGCNVTIKFSDDLNAWVITSTLPVPRSYL